MAGKKRLTKEILEAIVARQYKGEKLTDIAAELGFTRKGIYLAAKREGVEMKNKRHDKSVVMNKILKRKAEIENGTLSMHGLARELGLTQPYISTRCKQLGIKSPFQRGLTPQKIEEYEKALDYLVENGGYLTQAIRALGLKVDRHTVHNYAKSIGFDVKLYRYSNHIYGYWKILPGIPERCYTCDFKVTAVCMLCNTEHKVLITNLRGGTSECCTSCASANRQSPMMKCDETGEVHRSVRSFTRAIGLLHKYQTVKRRIRIDGFYEHEGLTYRPV